jgi:hypothetical protein
VLDYASQGQLIEWEEDDARFFYVKEPESTVLLPEDELRPIFRDCLLGLSYRKKHKKNKKYHNF